MTITTIAPHSINWNYTYSCNLSCNHCYSRSPKYPNELSTDDYLNIAQQIIDAKVFSVGLGGGEPLIRKDYVLILNKLGRAGVQTHITTNGWFVDQKVAEKLAKIRLGMLGISLDSPYEEAHDTFRNQPGSFRKVIEAIRNSVEVGLKVYLSSVVNATNTETIENFVTFGEQEKIAGINFKIFRPAGQGLINKDKYILSSDVLSQVVEKINELKSQTSLDISLYQDAGTQGCYCGITQLTIRPNGDVSMCPYDGQVIGNVIKTPLEVLWLESFELNARRNGKPCCIAEKDQTWLFNPNMEEQDNKVFVNTP